MKLFCTTEINVHFYKKFLHLSQSLRRRKNKTIDSKTTINRIKLATAQQQVAYKMSSRRKSWESKDKGEILECESAYRAHNLYPAGQ